MSEVAIGSIGALSNDDLGSTDQAQVDTQQNLTDTVLETTVEGQDTDSPNLSDAAVDSSALDNALAALAQEQKAASQKAQAPDEEEAEDVEQEEPEKKSKQGKYSKRVQSLVDRAKRAEEQIAYERNQTRAYIQHLQAQFEALKAETAAQKDDYLKRQLDILERRNRAEEDAGLSDVERARRKFLADAKEAAKQELMPEIQRALAEANASKAEIQKAREQAEQAARVRNWQSQISNQLNAAVFKGFDPADSQTLQGEAEEMLAAYGGAYGMEPHEAAPKFKQFLDRYALAKMKAISRGGGAKVAASKAAGSPLPAGRSGNATAGRNYTIQELQAKGFKDHIAWAARGRPPL